MKTIDYIRHHFQLQYGGPAAYTSIAVVIPLLFLLRFWYRHATFKRAYGKATYQPAFTPMTLPGLFFGLGLQFTWDQRFTLYRKIPRELISLEPMIFGNPVMYTNSTEVMRQIAGAGTATPWHKPGWALTTTQYWGNSLLTVNDGEWRRQRRIVQPSFNSRTYETVWKETKRLYNEMLVADKWPTRTDQTKAFTRAQTFTQRVALCVILSCGFGLPTSWSEKNYASADDDFSLDEGIQFQSDNIIMVAHAPPWLYYLPLKRVQYVRKATRAMRSWFNNAVITKKAEILKTLADTGGDMESESLKRDVFSRLVLASQMDSKSRLEESEIIGNTWVMYFAGHDTTASVLAAALCLLAVHKAEQKIILDEVLQVVKETADETLGFTVYESLIKTRSCFAEAVRMYPAGSLMIRETREDTIIQVPCGTDVDGKLVEDRVPLPKGTVIIGDMVGMQYNPRTFPQPEVFRPSRWYDAATDEAYTAFSVSARSCIGRRFALVEGTCFLAHLIRDFEVEPLLEHGESLDAWKSRVIERTVTTMTLSILESPLTFRRR